VAAVGADRGSEENHEGIALSASLFAFRSRQWPLLGDMQAIQIGLNHLHLQ